MSITVQSEDGFLTGPAASGEGSGEGRAAGFAGSAVLHGLLGSLGFPRHATRHARLFQGCPVNSRRGLARGRHRAGQEGGSRGTSPTGLSVGTVEPGRERGRAVGERTARRARRQAQGLGRVAPARRRDDERRQRLRANNDDRGQRGDGGRACRRQGRDQGSGDAQVESRFEGPERGRFLGADPRARGKRRRGAEGGARRHAALGRSRLSRNSAQRQERRA